MSKLKYDSTVARIAGNILSGVMDESTLHGIGFYENFDPHIVKGAVVLARGIIQATKDTEPEPEGKP